MPTRSGSATPMATRQFRRTASRCLPAPPTRARSTRWKIRIRRLGTNNWYTEDGYGGGGNAGYPPPYSANPVSGGGSYSNCSDPSQPGVKPILDYLKSLPRPIDAALRGGPLLSAEQLQSGLVRQRQERLYRYQPGQHAVHDPAVTTAEHRRQPERPATSPGSTTAISGITTSTIPIS